MFNFYIFRQAKVNEFIALSKTQGCLCFILVGQLFGALNNEHETCYTGGQYNRINNQRNVYRTSDDTHV